MGHTPSTAGTFRKKFRKNSGKTPETLSERFLEFPSRVRLGCPKPYNSRHLRLPERFQNSLPPSTAGDASFSRIGSGEGLSELVMEFPAVLGVFLMELCRSGDGFQGHLNFSEDFSLLVTFLLVTFAWFFLGPDKEPRAPIVGVSRGNTIRGNRTERF